jgi:glutathione S-transferase
MELVIGTPAWSTWSLRPWLVMTRAGLEFSEVRVALRQGEATAAAIAPHSPSGQIPVLKDGDLAIWDSLAICEYLAERTPGLWPADAAARALARAATAEMHSGFMALRRECAMQLDDPPRDLQLSEDAAKNVTRILALWRDMLSRFGGPFLAGEWSIADAFYTPVATRFRTYRIDLAAHGDADGAAQAYADLLLGQPEFIAWEKAAAA